MFGSVAKVSTMHALIILILLLLLYTTTNRLIAIFKFNLNFFLYFLRQCGIKDPSWSEIKRFVCFLDTQLRSCEKSVFCDEDIVGDVMSGLKTFVVKFMIRMSKVRTIVLQLLLQYHSFIIF